MVVLDLQGLWFGVFAGLVSFAFWSVCGFLMCFLVCGVCVYWFACVWFVLGLLWVGLDYVVAGCYDVGFAFGCFGVG